MAGVARRRRFSDAFKRRVLEEVDRARPGEIGLILRREGLYSSQLAEWRRWRSGMAKQPGSKQTVPRAEFERVVKAEAMLELQKKAAALLSSLDETAGSDS